MAKIVILLSVWPLSRIFQAFLTNRFSLLETTLNPSYSYRPDSLPSRSKFDFLFSLGFLAVKWIWFPPPPSIKLDLGVNILANNQPSRRAQGFLPFTSWKECYFIALMEPSNSTTDGGSQSFEKRNANQMLEPSQVWITEFQDRGDREDREQKVIMLFCPLMHCEGGMKEEWTTEKQPELHNSSMATRPPAPSPPQTLPDASRHPRGRWAVRHPTNGNKQMCFAHAALLQTPHLVVGRLNVFLTSSSSTTNVVYLMF